MIRRFSRVFRNKCVRAGHSMIEVMVVMTLVGAIVPVGLANVHRMLSQQKFSDRENQMHQVVERVEQLWRSDVGAANIARRLEETAGSPLQLEFADGSQIVYAIDGASICRTMTRPEPSVQVDHFRLPDNYALRWDASGLPTRVVLIVEAIPSGPGFADSSRTVVAESEPSAVRSADEMTSSLTPRFKANRTVSRIEVTVGRTHRRTATTTGGRRS